MADEDTEQIIGSAIEVHRHLGCGLLETIYEEALCYEFELKGLPFERQKKMEVFYKNRSIKGQTIDLVAYNQIIIEIKATLQHHEIYIAQLLSYLKSTQLKRGLLLNFGAKIMIDGIKRISL